MKPCCVVGTFFSLCLVVSAWSSEGSRLAPERIPFDSLAGFRPQANGTWRLAGDVAGDPRMDRSLAVREGVGILVASPTRTSRDHLFTTWEHGDIEVDLDFLLPPGSNSGVYLQGRYEVQLLDSWGVSNPGPGDCGGIYKRWDGTRPEGQREIEGTAPRANACRAPGLWQHLHVEFEAPRFDTAGRKVRSARFVRVVLNGFVIHENVEVSGPTRSAAFENEAPLGPLMVQGDHGSVALRNLAVKRRDAGAGVRLEGLTYQVHTGEYRRMADYESQPATAEGELAALSLAPIRKGPRLGLVLSGRMVVPRDGDYAFAVESSGAIRLRIDDQLAIVPFERGSTGLPVRLSAGAHAFRLDYHKTNSSDRQFLRLTAEGPGFEGQVLTAADSSPAHAAAAARAIRIEPEHGRVRVQRSFVPYQPRKRLYAINVGSPEGVHYAYDFETGGILRAWRGGWLDAADMWEGRGEPQVAMPAGPALDFNAWPFAALIENALRDGWPREADALWSSQGYVLEPNGQPVFRSTLAAITIQDRISPLAGGKGLARTVTMTGRRSDWQTALLLAEADQITPQPGGRGWIVGDRQWYLDWPANAPHMPIVQERGGRQQLVVRISEATLTEPLSYSIVW